SYELTLAKYAEEKRVLVDPKYGTKKREETDRRNKVLQAKDELDRAILNARAKEVQARTDRDTKKSVYEQNLTKYREIEEEIKKCKICAPQDGLVVYYVAEGSRYGVGRQAVVAQSETVAENQKLMQIPDLEDMLVNVKVHEAVISKIKVGQSAVIRVDAFPDQLLHGEVVSVATVPSQQDWMSSDIKVYATKVRIKDLPKDKKRKPGMSAEVTIS